MKHVMAVVFRERCEVAYQKVQVPDLGPDDVWVKTTVSWISNGTESSFLRSDRVDGIEPWKKGMKRPFPLVPGYQKIGVITEVGENVQHFKIGQRVFVTNTKVNGMHLPFGGHISEGPVAAKDVILLPETSEPEAYSGLVLTQVGWNSGMRGDVPIGSKTVVIGDGMVGLWAAQTLQSRGMQVALVGKHPMRMEKFVSTEEDCILSSDSDHQWLHQLADWADGKLAICVDTVGNDVNHAVNDQLIAMLQWGGHFVAAGHHGHHGMIDMRKLTRSELTLHCPCGWTESRLAETMRWIYDGKLDTLRLVTHRFPAHKAQTAWEAIMQRRSETLGVLLTWSDDFATREGEVIYDENDENDANYCSRQERH